MEGDMTADTAMPTYTKRWRIENFFADNAFLGVIRAKYVPLRRFFSSMRNGASKTPRGVRGRPPGAV